MAMILEFQISFQISNFKDFKYLSEIKIRYVTGFCAIERWNLAAAWLILQYMNKLEETINVVGLGLIGLLPDNVLTKVFEDAYVGESWGT